MIFGLIRRNELKDMPSIESHEVDIVDDRNLLTNNESYNSMSSTNSYFDPPLENYLLYRKPGMLALNNTQSKPKASYNGNDNDGRSESKISQNNDEEDDDEEDDDEEFRRKTGHWGFGNESKSIRK